MLTATRLGKHYGKAPALTGVSFELHPGEVTAIIGANGAGKTTLIKCLLGLLQFEGDVLINGIDARKKPKDARRHIGYVAQTPAFHPDLTVSETMVFYAALREVPVEEARERIASVNLDGEQDKLAGALSGGMRQRLALAVALLGSPPLLILDEPTSGLDIASRIELRELVTSQRTAGTSVLLSTHWMEDVPYIADRALVLDNGRLVYDGSTTALAGTEAAGSRLYLRLNGHSKEVAPRISELTGHEVRRSGDWLVATCPPAQKAAIVESLVASGVHVLDFRVEEASVEEAVMRFRRQQGDGR